MCHFDCELISIITLKRIVKHSCNSGCFHTRGPSTVNLMMVNIYCALLRNGPCPFGHSTNEVTPCPNKEMHSCCIQQTITYEPMHRLYVVFKLEPDGQMVVDDVSKCSISPASIISPYSYSCDVIHYKCVIFHNSPLICVWSCIDGRAVLISAAVEHEC